VLPPKGKVFDYPWLNRFTGKTYTLKAKLVKKSGKQISLELINPPSEYTVYLGRATPRTSEGNPIITIPALDLTFTGIKPGVEGEIAKLDRTRHDLYEELKSRDTSREDEYDKRYEVQRHAWTPTPYSRTDQHEWFAELCATHALGHLDPIVTKWLLSIISTGRPPDEMALPAFY
jgi:hypothetical protein